MPPVDLFPIALQYAEKGRPVFALSPGSKIPPAGSKGVSEASTDPQVIRELFERAGPGAGIGLVSGPEFFVLDVDVKLPVVDEKKRKGRGLWTGFEALDMLACFSGWELPETREAETPSGGAHKWFSMPSDIIAPMKHLVLYRGEAELEHISGLDIRSVGSYVVAPPTRTEAGLYRWVNKGSAVEAPGWLVALLRPVTPPAPVSAPHTPRAHENGYCAAVLRTAIKALEDPSSGHHDRTFAQARLVGGYVGGGHLNRGAVEEELVLAADRGRPGRGTSNRRTVAQGLDAGERFPCHPPERG